MLRLTKSKKNVTESLSVKLTFSEVRMLIKSVKLLRKRKVSVVEKLSEKC